MPTSRFGSMSCVMSSPCSYGLGRSPARFSDETVLGRLYTNSPILTYMCIMDGRGYRGELPSDYRRNAMTLSLESDQVH